MSWHESPPARSHAAAFERDPVELVVVPRTSDLGGFEVRRALPSRRKRAVGPFVFLDQMGPSDLPAGKGLDVLAHPHIGLATVTYLFDGEILHRDSLGSIQAIRPGEVNWMTAGHGIVHSERTTPEHRSRRSTLSGIQAWVALPEDAEESDPAFSHHAGTVLPVIEDGGVTVRVIAGAVYGQRSPVRTASETLCADAVMAPGAVLPVDAEHVERALYVAHGEIAVGDGSYGEGNLLVLRPGDPISVEARRESRVMLLGGEPLDGPRYMWWNFVSSRKDRIEQAKTDWRAGRFAGVPGESESIPLPMPGPSRP